MNLLAVICVTTLVLCIQLMTAEAQGCPTIKTTIQEHYQRLEVLEIKVKKIEQTCVSKRQYISTTTNVFGKIDQHLQLAKEIFTSCGRSSSVDHQRKVDKWLGIIDYLHGTLKTLHPERDLHGTEVQTCITTVTEITQKITRIRTELRQIEVETSCDHVSVRLRGYHSEYEQMEITIKRLTEISEKKIALLVPGLAPYRGRAEYNTQGGPLFYKNTAAVINHGTIKDSQVSLYSSNVVKPD